MIGEEEDEDNFVFIEVEDHQVLKQIEDQTADLIMCLDSTMDSVSTFMDMYEHFQVHYDNGSPINGSPMKSAYGSDAILFALKEKKRWISEYRKKAQVLLSKVQNTRTLISSLLERQSGRNTNQQISALHSLEKQGQDENSTMRQLAEKNSRDSSSMRILTIITMIYLPCTINFYSTQFVNQKETATGKTTLVYTQNAWIFFAISVPLTLLTICIWWSWVNSENIVHVFRKRSSLPKSSRTGIPFLRNRKPPRGLPR
ncbi:hypothetical protein K491DRAFT_596212 [Lophiostoma macrostomum CBS 122681]|uniref:Uncharacterized protein n=1 Tax=Lophiostoma macrostomum CBS 122681 TaxID=1314788 RepID=A0A6A6TBU2_9PLEO|nr:hypothetical protein K491DRAFT_596212 [Lophiostoma macrostomum CBS 122681]